MPGPEGSGLRPRPPGEPRPDHAGVAAIDAARYREVLGHFATGVAIITGLAGDRPVGFTAQTLSSVSLDPPLISFCVRRGSASWAGIRSTGAFCANVLTHKQEALCRTFATQGVDRFRGVGWRPARATGSPLLDGVLGWVEATVEAEHEGGDHSIVVGRVVDLGSGGEGRPLLFYRGGFGSFQP